MHYPGPEPTDFDNVRALNTALLSLLLRAGQATPVFHRDPPEGLRAALGRLGRLQRERLASVPFLLFSLRERDGAFWEGLLADTASLELFPETPPLEGDCGKLVAAGLSFAWQLAHRNAFALRLLTGASLHWCEELAARPLVEVLDRAGARADVVELRCSDNAAFWAKLVEAGVSARSDVRSAAHLTAWQTMLTRVPAAEPRALASAACRNRVPALKVAEKPRN
ncbi:MAG: hypothetical protein OEW35_19740 [Gammaproteobacteria bacterium]|nr:hypothetical protein [Gammaproteobacteria bacterium]MDH4254980.1 hypothetical protein [Gammaproteobacteria bacterium]MDH5311439.1 hypothetical protein [Gammaproteobacteria bacterium]